MWQATLVQCDEHAAARVFDAARICYEALLDGHHNAFDVQHAYARLLLAQGTDATAALEAAIALASPPYEQAHLDAFQELGMLYSDHGDLDRAAAVYTIPLMTTTNRSDARLVPIMVNLGAVLLAQWLLDDARAITLEALVGRLGRMSTYPYLRQCRRWRPTMRRPTTTLVASTTILKTLRWPGRTSKYRQQTRRQLIGCRSARPSSTLPVTTHLWDLRSWPATSATVSRARLPLTRPSRFRAARTAGTRSDSCRRWPKYPA